MAAEKNSKSPRDKIPADAPAWLDILEFDPESAESVAHDRFLGDLRASLPGLPALNQETDRTVILEALHAREGPLQEQLSAFYCSQMSFLASRDLTQNCAYVTLFAHTRLIDSLLRFAFELSLQELPVLVRLQLLDGEQEVEFKNRLLPQKREKLAAFRKTLRDGVDSGPADQKEQDYLRGIESTLVGEIAEVEGNLATLKEELPVLRGFLPNPERLRQRVVMFARGGYGRAEMSFASDLDNGYCLDTEGLKPGEAAIYRELFMRAEALLNKAEIHTQHQYFEIDEDFSRFTEPETLHTITSILEARPIAGNSALLERLKTKFLQILPEDAYLQNKLAEYEEQGEPSLLRMNLKSDRGGLRTIQIPLWILGVVHGARSFMTVDLLRLGCEVGMLTPPQATVLARSLECLHELRNFVGAAERYYDDQESRESNIHISRFKKDEFNDGLARLYLLRKQRFESIDALDGHRLQLRRQTRRVARRLLDRVLDRTVVHALKGFSVEVHQGHKEIIALRHAKSGRATRLPGLLRDSHTLMELFVHIAESGYGLSDGISESLGGLVSRVRTVSSKQQDTVSGGKPGGVTGTEQDSLSGTAQESKTAGAFSRLMLAPHSHAALEAMFRIFDPDQAELCSLMGHFIPELDRMHFRVRHIQQHTALVHEHLLYCVEHGQRGLIGLRASHTELYALLQPRHILALKWSLLLHRVSHPGQAADDSIHSAELAVEVLERLGYRDEELLVLVRLLVEHHRTVAALSLTATYVDQALARYFEVSNRNVVHIVLLYLVNLAVLVAAPGRDESHIAAIQRFFGEAGQILSSVRGVLQPEQALDLINLYFDQKREGLIADTRTELLYRKILVHGLESSVLGPVERHHSEEWTRLESKREQLESMYRTVVLGSNQPHLREQIEQRMVHALRDWLPVPLIQELTADRSEAFGWFFAAVPNRYLMAATPRELAEEVIRFIQFRTEPVTVDLVISETMGVESLLINTMNLGRSHMRVAYALNRMRINIQAGKINRYELSDGSIGYFYYFQISRLDPQLLLSPRDLELAISEEVPPEFTRPTASAPYRVGGTRVEFAGNDGKGYLVQEQAGQFVRQPAELATIRVVFRDQPFLYFKVCRAFEMFGVEIQQALITTTGNQVQDYFYLDPRDSQRLFESNFEETLIQLMNADVLEPRE